MKKNIDFLVTAVDNFGDTGFALDLAESVLSERPDWTVRFFSDDRELFERLSARRPHAKVAYFELSGYGNVEPSETIVSFFDRKIPEAHFAKYAFPKKILQISYLRFDADSADRPGVGSLNGTRYRIGGDEVVHLVPSPLPEGAGVVVRKGASGQVPVPGFPNFSERHLTSFDSWKIPKPGTGTLNLKTLVSAFFYPETRTKLEAMGRIDPECRFAEFGNAEAEIPLPFLRFDEYAEVLASFDANVVRGENSAVKAILAGKPFLWDFYKEKNGAHAAKIEDFLLFTEPFFERREDFQTYAEATRAFNSDVFGKPEIETCLKILVRPSPETLRAFASMGKEVSERDMTKRILSEIG